MNPAGIEDGMLILNASDPEQNLLDICSRLGLKTDASKDRLDSWDGQSIRWPVGGSTPVWLAHEIAHWLVASPEMRALPNYGFRRDPNNHLFTLPNGRGLDKFDPEEMLALWLGILLAVFCGEDPFDCERWMQVIWGEKFVLCFSIVTIELHRRRFIVEIVSGPWMGPRSWRLSKWMPVYQAIGMPEP